ncbi:MAG: DUF4375 domain-containing protein [Alphaproteobacteria bacterium]
MVQETGKHAGGEALFPAIWTKFLSPHKRVHKAAFPIIAWNHHHHGKDKVACSFQVSELYVLLITCQEISGDTIWRLSDTEQERPLCDQAACSSAFFTSWHTVSVVNEGSMSGTAHAIWGTTVVIRRSWVQNDGLPVAISEFVGDVIHAGGYLPHELPPKLMQVHHVGFYIGQINNGGHSQFISNCGEDFYAISADVQDGLKAMDALAQHQILIEMIALATNSEALFALTVASHASAARKHR